MRAKKMEEQKLSRGRKKIEGIVDKFSWLWLL